MGIKNINYFRFVCAVYIQVFSFKNLAKVLKIHFSPKNVWATDSRLRSLIHTYADTFSSHSPVIVNQISDNPQRQIRRSCRSEHMPNYRKQLPPYSIWAHVERGCDMFLSLFIWCFVSKYCGSPLKIIRYPYQSLSLAFWRRWNK